jgi:hypothetical protein
MPDRHAPARSGRSRATVGALAQQSASNARRGPRFVWDEDQQHAVPRGASARAQLSACANEDEWNSCQPLFMTLHVTQSYSTRLLHATPGRVRDRSEPGQACKRRASSRARKTRLNERARTVPDYCLVPGTPPDPSRQSSAGNLAGNSYASFRNPANVLRKFPRVSVLSGGTRISLSFKSLLLFVWVISSLIFTRICAGTIDDSCAADSY